MKEKKISIRGAKVNNLKNIDLDIPRNKFVVITGLSGSGKSSLAFDTLYAEGQRRYVESLSSYARQFMGRMKKPDVKSITGIPPAIAIEQQILSRNPRSTVGTVTEGTVTEIYEYLKLLFARIGHTYSPVSGLEVHREDVKDVMRYNFVKEKTNFFDVKAGQFVIFFPTDWHIAKLNNKKKNDSQQIRVIVVKMDYKD